MMETVNEYAKQDLSNLGREDQTLLLFARLMEGGQEDSDTVNDLDALTKLLQDDLDARKKDKSICDVIDSDCFDTILCYLDMRQPDVVRGHATLTTSAYLKASGTDGSKMLRDFFQERVKRGTYDDYIVAFCVAAAIFPIVPDLITELFLSEGFLPSLGPLMRRKWKSRKVETACLEMLNAACMNQQCREAVQKYCVEWLEEVVDQDPDEAVKSMFVRGADGSHSEEGSVSMRRHSENVQHLAAVILAKLRAIQPAHPPTGKDGDPERVQQASTTIEELSKMFTDMLIKDPEHSRNNSIEGLAYASLRPNVKEELAKNKEFLKQLVKTLENAPPKSPLTYGALSILVNLTRFQPNKSEEEKKMDQLKAYANAAGKIAPDPLNDNEHVTARSSLSLIITIINSLSIITSIRGQLAQQGAVRLLIAAWNALPSSEAQTKRVAAQALARILISTDPSLVFGGTRPTPQSAAIRPLVSIIAPDQEAETRDLLPTFESLMALTNLASTDDDTRSAIVRQAWPDLEEQLLSSNAMVTKAAVELVCNLVQCVEAIALYADGSTKARDRLHVLLALADAEDEGTRSGAGGALATLAGVEEVVTALLARDRGVRNVLGLCADEDSEDIRHRGVFVVYSLVTMDGDIGARARGKVREEGGVDVLRECARRTRRPEVLDLAVQALKLLMEEN
ncbi:ctin cytoskeleton organization protein [Diaporthe amygdali]|uniref:ctin cytoskeleton organization protein n=1 Tax=Phomopsis amygdali TaxID=1214568 RepID=UPI0022FE0B5F|nr:ctin cytoskeleton organization protein [Diaporthe amygdali]KAJ0120829.1 ctin cytoskeleton organization protein [Diaporthe amygdali]